VRERKRRENQMCLRNKKRVNVKLPIKYIFILGNNSKSCDFEMDPQLTDLVEVHTVLEA
jgi:hypothetical protein